jgi:REP element-mobilizing transposase RayT
MPDQPLAYFITFSTYGTWLHGESPGSVDREHNEVGTPWLPPDPLRRTQRRERMAQEPYYLDEPRRKIVRDAIAAECRFRRWKLLVLHVRSNHVHLVVTADREPELVMRCCKAQASKCLNQAGFDDSERKRWTTHGSTKYLWDEATIAEKVDYTLNRQGEPMAIHDGRA